MMKKLFLTLLLLGSVVLFAAGDHLRLAVFTDVHLKQGAKVRGRRNFAQSERFLDTVIGEINATPQVDLAVNCGDLADSSFSELKRGAAKLQKLRWPHLNLAGNHDFIGQKNIPELEKALGVTGFGSSRVIGKWRIITLDESHWSFYRYHPKSAEYRKMKAFLPEKFGKFDPADGALNEAELKRLETELAAAQKAGQSVVLLSHAPIEPDGRKVVLRIQNSDAVKALMRKYNVVRFTVSGHVHEGGYAVRGNTGMLSVKSLIEAKKPTWVLLDLYPDHAVITGHGDEPSRRIDFMPMTKDPRAKGFDAFYSPQNGCDPERAEFAVGFNYQKNKAKERIAYFEVKDSPEGKVLRIVSRGDAKIAKGTQWSLFRSFLVPKAAKKLKIEFKVRLLDASLKTPQFMVGGQLADPEAPEKTLTASLKLANDGLRLGDKTVLKEDLSKGFHIFILELDAAAKKARIYRKNGKLIAERPLMPGPKEAPQLRFGDGSSGVFGEAELAYIGFTAEK